MRVTIKIDAKIHKKLKKLQYEAFRDTGVAVSLSDVIKDVLQK